MKSDTIFELFMRLFIAFYPQFYVAQLDILTVFILMPVTDLSTTGLVLVAITGLFTSLFLVPFNFLDTFILVQETTTQKQNL